MEQISILITDDHTLVRQSLATILNQHSNFKVVAEAGSGEEAVEMARQFRPSVVIMDINLPGMNGIEATSIIRKFSPGTKILGVSLHSQPAYVRKIMKAGASGYITKNSSSEEMIKAIEEIHSNHGYICEEIKNIIADQLIIDTDDNNRVATLSCREIDIVRNIIKGFSSKEIADSLGITAKTVEVHRYNIMKKLKLKNVASLVNYFNYNGLISNSGDA